MTQNTRHFDYADELIRLDKMPDLIQVPGLYELEVTSEIIRQREKRFIGIHVKHARPIRPRIPDEPSPMIKKDLIEYLFEASAGPCYCGSGKTWETCCARQDLPRLVSTVIEMSKRTH
jgi:hypothetical protein